MQGTTGREPFLSVFLSAERRGLGRRERAGAARLLHDLDVSVWLRPSHDVRPDGEPGPAAAGRPARPRPPPRAGSFPAGPAPGRTCEPPAPGRARRRRAVPARRLGAAVQPALGGSGSRCGARRPRPTRTRRELSITGDLFDYYPSTLLKINVWFFGFFLGKF